MIPAGTGVLPLIEPMLAVPARPFDDSEYYFEVKWDGYRCLAYLDNLTTLVSRNLKDITGTFPDLGGLFRRVKDTPLVLDGEIIVLNDDKPSFAALQSRAKLEDKNRIISAARSLPAIYMAFDILYYRGVSIMQRPLSERRECLQTVVDANDYFLISEPVRGEGVAFYRACVAQGLEGAMAKRVDSKYTPGSRSVYWKKLRHTREADLTVCGYRRGRGSRLLGSLVLAAWNGADFVYQGMVGSGLSRDEEINLLKAMNGLAADSCPIKSGSLPVRGVQWVRPRLVCRVEYLTLTREGIMRHPVYKGLRGDKSPEECTPAGQQN
ncbi:non-homologous end-joining DNA ligase [Desulfoscipio gibsoniae]